MNGTCEDAVGGRGRGVYDPPDLIDEVSGMDDGHGYRIGGTRIWEGRNMP